MRTKNLRIRVLIPLAAVLTFLVLSFLISFHGLQHQQVDDQSLNTFKETRRLFRANLANDANMLKAALEVIRHDEQTLRALQEKDVKTLLKRNQQIYKRLNANNRVTHFYFTGPDRVNLLRLHKPEKSHDLIDRFTTLKAEKSRRVAAGIELGPLGTFTLRVVLPCFIDDELIGYIELGEEIDHVVRNLKEIIGVELYVMIDKEYIRRSGWEEGMRMLKRPAMWDQFPTTVIIDQTLEQFPDFLVDFLSVKQDASLIGLIETDHDGRHYQATFIRLQDAGGRWVGALVAMHDITEVTRAMHKTSWFALLVTFLVGSGLFVFFYIFMGRIQTQLKDAERELKCQANQDGLTCIANRRCFDKTLKQEWRRARRQKQSLGLIMCDIDYFKLYNDRYGHQEGDHCLQGVAAALEEAMQRSGDLVARYGGEEFAIILPDTDLAGAMRVAENVRAQVAQRDIAHADSLVCDRVSLSLGVFAQVPDDRLSQDDFVALADKALYQAKQRGRNQVARATL